MSQHLTLFLTQMFIQFSRLATSVHLILINLAAQRKRGIKPSKQCPWFCLSIQGNGQTTRTGSANYRLQGKPCLLPVFVNEVLWEHNHVHSFTYCLWLLSCYSVRVGYLWQRLLSLKYLLPGPLQKKLADSCTRDRAWDGRLESVLLSLSILSSPLRVSISLCQGDYQPSV